MKKMMAFAVLLVAMASLQAESVCDKARNIDDPEWKTCFVECNAGFTLVTAGFAAINENNCKACAEWCNKTTKKKLFK